MPSEVILPRVDMDMAAGKISKWFVEDGAEVTKGQPLFEIETDKAAMEIDAPASGTIRDLATASDIAIPVGNVVAWIYAQGEAVTAPPGRKPSEAEQPIPRGTQDGPTPQLPARSEIADPANSDRPRATPMARRLAKERGLHLDGLSGSGPRGRIQAQDVLAASGAGEPTLAPALDDQRPVTDHPASQVETTSAEPRSSAASPLRLIRLRDGQGVPVLLVHGFGSDADGWRPFLVGRSARQPVHALDLPGHGRSPLGRNLSFESIVESVETALLGSELGAFDVIAHSLGAAVMTAVAARGAVEVRSLLLIAPAGLGPEINAAFIRGYVCASSEASLAPWMRELVADPSVITQGLVRTTLQTKAPADGHRAMADALFPDGTQAFSIRSDLARLPMPIRIVIGLADRIIPAHHARDLPGMVALHRFPDVGHMPQLERREAIAAIHAQMAGG